MDSYSGLDTSLYRRKLPVKNMDTSQFYKNLQNFFKPRNMLKETGNNSNWNGILQYIYENFQFVSDINDMHACNNFLLDSLIEFECSDENVIARILKMSWDVSTSRRKLKLAERYPRMGGLNRPVNAFLSPLNLADQESYSFELWSWWRTVFVVEFSDVRLMRVLIKYGLYYVPQDVTYEDLRLSTKFLTTFCTVAEQYEFNNMEVVNLPPNLKKLMKNLLHDLHCTHGCLRLANKESQPIKRGFRRILLITFTLTAIVLKLKKHAFLEDYIKCIILHFRVISEPLLTKEEVLSFLRCLFCHENYEEGIQRIVQIHESLFRAENAPQYSPRSLKHLCRCSLRKLITRQSQVLALAETVNVLQIPESLKFFLLGII